jgi:hypothetical protein
LPTKENVMSVNASLLQANRTAHGLVIPRAHSQTTSAPKSRQPAKSGADWPYRDCRLTFAVALAAALGSGFAAYQTLLGPLASTAAVEVTEAGPTADQHAPAISPQDRQAQFLVRSTLMALNDANRSGNYSVLRDLAGPRFQERNSVLRLREVFHGFREASVDLSHAGMAAPNLARRETRAADGILQLEGDLPMAETVAARRARFAMEFEPVQGHWRLLTLSVGIAAR